MEGDVGSGAWDVSVSSSVDKKVSKVSSFQNSWNTTSVMNKLFGTAFTHNLFEIHNSYG